MNEVLATKTAQLGLESNVQVHKSTSPPNGVGMTNGQKDKGPSNPWKSNSSAGNGAEKAQLEHECEWPSISKTDRVVVDEGTCQQKSTTIDDKKKGKTMWKPTTVPITYQTSTRPGQPPRPNFSGPRPRRGHPSSRPSAPQRPPNGYQALRPQQYRQQGWSRNPSKDDPSDHESTKGDGESEHHRRNGLNNKSEQSLSRASATKHQQAKGSGRKNTDAFMPEPPSLIPFSPANIFPVTTAAPLSQILLTSALVPTPSHTTGEVKTLTTQSMPTGEIVDLIQMISEMQEVGWDHVQLPPSLLSQPEIIEARRLAGITPAPTDTPEVSDSTSRGATKNDVAILDSQIYFVPKSVYQTKFVKFSSKLDYIKHHIRYYFSKSNLTRDEHLKKILSANNQACPIEDLLQFNRLRVVNTTETELMEAAAHCNAVQVFHEAGGKISLLPQNQHVSHGAGDEGGNRSETEMLSLISTPAGLMNPLYLMSAPVDAITSPVIDPSPIAMIPIFNPAAAAAVAHSQQKTEISVATTSTEENSSSSGEPVSSSMANFLGQPQSQAITVSAASPALQTTNAATQSQVSSSVTGAPPSVNGVTAAAPASIPLVQPATVNNLVFNPATVVTSPGLHPFGFVQQPAYIHPLMGSGQAPLSTLPGFQAMQWRMPTAQMPFQQIWFPTNAGHPGATGIFTPVTSNVQLYHPDAATAQPFLLRGHIAPLMHPGVQSNALLQNLVTSQLGTQQAFYASPAGHLGNTAISSGHQIFINPHAAQTASYLMHSSLPSRFMAPASQFQQSPAAPDSTGGTGSNTSETTASATAPPISK